MIKKTKIKSNSGALLFMIVLIMWKFKTTNALIIDCEFNHFNLCCGFDASYGCEVKNANDLVGDNVKVDGITGTHWTANNINDVQFLWLNNSKSVTKIPKNLDTVFPSLTTIVINSCGLTELTRDNLKSIGNLKYLDLKKNQLKVIPEDSFKDNPNLEVISLYYNQIERIDKMTFRHLTKLRDLDLHTNKLKVVDEDIFKDNLNLEVISIHSNQIEKIGKLTFDHLIKLRELYLYNNSLKVVPEDIFKDNLNLEVISLQYNQIEHIDEKTFNHLTQLRGLDLHNNNLRAINEDTFKENLNLKKIWMNNNQIEHIEKMTFSHLTDLIILNFSNNSLCSTLNHAGSRLEVESLVKKIENSECQSEKYTTSTVNPILAALDEKNQKLEQIKDEIRRLEEQFNQETRDSKKPLKKSCSFKYKNEQKIFFVAADCDEE